MSGHGEEHKEPAAEAAADHGGGHGGGGSGLWSKLTAPITNSANQLYGKGVQQLTSVFDPREGAAHSTGFLRGDVVEAGYDIFIGATVLNTKDRIVDVFTKGGRNVENTMLQIKKVGTTPLTSPVALAGNIIKVPVVIGNEGADFVASGIGAGYDLVRNGIEGAFLRPVDLLAAQTKEKLGYIPVVGKALGIGIGGSLNLMNRVISTPLKVTDWVKKKVGGVMDWGFNKVRKHTIDEAGHGGGDHGGSGHEAHAPAADHGGGHAAPAGDHGGGHGGH